jgi:hypothetical protein
MHCANASWMTASFSMYENVPPVASAMTCIAAASWLWPKPNVWMGADQSPTPVGKKDGGTSTS